MQVLVPITLADAMVTTWGAPEPSSSETAWASAGSYTLGDVRIRATTHRKYRALVSHTGRTALPEVDVKYWVDVGPTDRYAMFDSSGSTQTINPAAPTTLSVVVQPGFFNCIALFNLSGISIAVTVKDAPAGSTIYSYSGALDGPYVDWYEWLFDPYRYVKKLILSDIVPYGTAEVSITVTGDATNSAGIGACLFGDLRDLVGYGNDGGTEYHATASPIDSSYVTTDDYGQTKVVRRPTGTDMRAQVWLEQEDADYALSVIQSVVGVPTVVIATAEPGYDGLTVFGLVNASLSYDSTEDAVLDINVKGLT